MVGGNGSGKTTALKLIHALLVPNFLELVLIPFQDIMINVAVDNDDIIISAKKIVDVLVLSISGVSDMLELPLISDVEIDYYKSGDDRGSGAISSMNRRYADHMVLKKIAELPTPIYLGLDRRREDAFDQHADYYLERKLNFGSSVKKAQAAKRLIKGALGISLMETELMIQNAYKRVRDVEKSQSDKLRNNILLSSFKYIENTSGSLFKFPDSKERAVLLDRKKDIFEILQKMGLGDEKLNSELNIFFEKMTYLLESEDNNDHNYLMELLVNKAQIDRMSKILEIIDEHKSRVSRLYGRIDNFLAMVNDFYCDSNKLLEVNSVGELVVKKPNGELCTIEGLSSGERQVLIIFAHAYFYRYQQQNAKTVFIIDEPELSLHVYWQEKFANAIMSINPKNQFILATHSPEIVGLNKSKAIKCR